MSACSVDECERPAKGKRDWCGMHTERWRRWGDPTETRPRIRAACTEEGCDLLNEARGLCKVHYLRARRHAMPKKPRKTLPLVDRLDRHIDKSAGPDGCWPWTGKVGPRGYGQTYITRDGRKITTGAHRARYIAEYGEMPDGLFVLHSCDNPPCCNPTHLRAGTHRDNMADRQTHGAGYARGNEAVRAIQVDDETEQAIRAAYKPRARGRGQHAVAQRFGLSRTTVQRIVTKSDRWAESA